MWHNILLYSILLWFTLFYIFSYHIKLYYIYIIKNMYLNMIRTIQCLYMIRTDHQASNQFW